MENTYGLCELALTITGPLMLACIVIMYASVALRTGRPPRPAQALYLYVRHSVETRRHAGVMTYMLMICTMFFLVSLICMVVIRLKG